MYHFGGRRLTAVLQTARRDLETAVKGPGRTPRAPLGGPAAARPGVPAGGRGRFRLCPHSPGRLRAFSKERATSEFESSEKVRDCEDQL